MITVVKEISDLEKREFTFVWIDGNLFLDWYILMKRESKRHRYVTEKRYSRINLVDSNIEESEVPLTLSVKAKALELAKEKIKCLKWSERNKNS